MMAKTSTPTHDHHSGLGSASNVTPTSPASVRRRTTQRDALIRKKVEAELSRKKATSSNIPVPVRRGAKGTVTSLRPSPAITVRETTKVVEVAQMMAAAKTDAVLVCDKQGRLCGILTDKDVAHRVVAGNLDIRTTTVVNVMTKNPISVDTKASANEALNRMVDGNFRHLPVVHDHEEDDIDNIVGILDITKCLYDAFKKMDEAHASTKQLFDAIQNMGSLANSAELSSLKEWASLLKEKVKNPDLATVLNSRDDSVPPQVNVRFSVRDAAKEMKAHHQTAVLVFDDEKGLAGIFTTKDIVLRVIAAGLDPATTSVIRVMTPRPDTVSSDLTVLDALRKMHERNYLHLPVVDGKSVVGLINILQLTYFVINQLQTMGGESGSKSNDWTTLLADPTMTSVGDLDHEFSEASSQNGHSFATTAAGGLVASNGYMMDDYSMTYSNTSSPTRVNGGDMTFANNYDPTTFVFKLRDEKTGKNYRFVSQVDNLDDLIITIKGRVGYSEGDLKIFYEDDENDRVLLSSDTDLLEAVNMARRSGWDKLALFVNVNGGMMKESAMKASRSSLWTGETVNEGNVTAPVTAGSNNGGNADNMQWVSGAVVGVAVVAAVAFVLAKWK